MDFIILILLLIFLSVPFLSYAVFWYETSNSSYRHALKKISDGKPAFWVLRGIFSSLVSNTLFLAFFPLGWFSRLWRPGIKEKNSRPVVVLIHGLYHNADAWIFYRRWLRKKGYDRIYTFSYGGWRSDFQQVYERFENWMVQVKQESPNAPIVMIGHSLGGLLARNYAVNHNRSQHNLIRGVITLGTPFKGSKMVVFGFGTLAADLLFEGPLILELANHEIPPDLHAVAIYSPVDNMVLPTISLHPPDGWIEKQTSPLCHMAALYHKPTFRCVLGHIEKALSKQVPSHFSIEA